MTKSVAVGDAREPSKKSFFVFFVFLLLASFAKFWQVSGVTGCTNGRKGFRRCFGVVLKVSKNEKNVFSRVKQLAIFQASSRSGWSRGGLWALPSSRAPDHGQERVVGVG